MGRYADDRQCVFNTRMVRYAGEADSGSQELGADELETTSAPDWQHNKHTTLKWLSHLWLAIG